MGETNGEPEPVVQWMTTKQAAQYLQVARRTLYTWMDKGTLPFFVVPSGRRRIRKQDLDALLVRAEPSGGEGAKD